MRGSLGLIVYQVLEKSVIISKELTTLLIYSSKNILFCSSCDLGNPTIQLSQKVPITVSGFYHS
jgi:hypothetical protein